MYLKYMFQLIINVWQVAEVEVQQYNQICGKLLFTIEVSNLYHAYISTNASPSSTFGFIS